MEPKLHYVEEVEVEIDGKIVKEYIPHYFPPEPTFEERIIEAYKEGVNSI